jgi:hypothetical protein
MYSPSRNRARSWLVEEKDRCVLQQRARDADALLLAARQHAAFVADDRLVAVRLAEDEVVRVRELRCGPISSRVASSRP